MECNEGRVEIFCDKLGDSGGVPVEGDCVDSLAQERFKNGFARFEAYVAFAAGATEKNGYFSEHFGLRELMEKEASQPAPGSDFRTIVILFKFSRFCVAFTRHVFLSNDEWGGRNLRICAGLRCYYGKPSR